MTSTRIRMTPDDRREQLLDLGVHLLATRSLDDVSIDQLAEEAGISRGLLYHYFGNKADFRRAVVRRAADELIAVTAPVAEGEPMARLERSLEAYVDYVAANYEGYASLVRGAASGNGDLREIYEEARAALTDRIFEVADRDYAGGVLAVMAVEDSPAVRLMVRGWSALAEEVVLSWVGEDRGVSKQQLLGMLAAALPGALTGC
ncbi:MAG: TetR/AcrR family transcriptional regulator [Nocardioidaceae bacterium]